MGACEVRVAAVPQPCAEDDDDVRWALSTASALLSAGAREDALKWLRRAAETAIELDRDERGLELLYAAAEVAAMPPSAAPPSTPPSAPPPSSASGSSLARGTPAQTHDEPPPSSAAPTAATGAEGASGGVASGRPIRGRIDAQPAARRPAPPLPARGARPSRPPGRGGPQPPPKPRAPAVATRDAEETVVRRLVVPAAARRDDAPTHVDDARPARPAPASVAPASVGPASGAVHVDRGRAGGVAGAARPAPTKSAEAPRSLGPSPVRAPAALPALRVAVTRERDGAARIVALAVGAEPPAGSTVAFLLLAAGDEAGIATHLLDG